MLGVTFIQCNVYENIYLYLSHYLYSMIFSFNFFAHFLLLFHLHKLLPLPCLRSSENSSTESNILLLRAPKRHDLSEVLSPTELCIWLWHKFHVMDQFSNIKFFWKKIKYGRSLNVLLKANIFSLPSSINSFN